LVAFFLSVQTQLYHFNVEFIKELFEGFSWKAVFIIIKVFQLIIHTMGLQTLLELLNIFLPGFDIITAK
jgi:hypothetical protein